MTMSPTIHIINQYVSLSEGRLTNFGRLAHLEKKGCLMLVLRWYQRVICDVVVVEIGLCDIFNVAVLISDSAWLS